MDEYMRTIDGNTHSMTEIKSAIAGEEALATKFVKCQITAIDRKITKVVTFREEEETPGALKLLDHDPPPRTVSPPSGAA